MPTAEDLLNFLDNFKFAGIVYEDQLAGLIHAGRYTERPFKQLKGDLKDKVEAAEKELIEKLGGEMGRFAFLNPFYRPELPEDFRYDGLFRTPKDRFDEHLSPGVYFLMPFVDHLYKATKNVQSLNVGNITVLTSDQDSKTMLVSCNIRYDILRLKKLYLKVDNYEKDLCEQSVSVLNNCCRGKTFEQWKTPEFIKQLADEVKVELRKDVTEPWGIRIQEVYITHGVPCEVKLATHDGQTLPLSATVSYDHVSPR